MARIANTRRSLVRRAAVLMTIAVAAGSGLVALEHTATGASTGSNYGQTSHHDGHDKDHETSTTMKKPPMGGNCNEGHGRHDDKKFDCRVPSGGQNPKPHDHNGSQSDQNNRYGHH